MKTTFAIWPTTVLALIAACGAFFVAGCDTLYGFRRYAAASQIPPPEKVKEVLSSMPEVKAVSFMLVQPPRHFSLYKGISKDPDYYQFSITGGDSFTVLTLGKLPGREIEFYSLWMNRAPADVELKKSRALADSVYTALVAQFPGLPKTSAFVETNKTPN